MRAPAGGSASRAASCSIVPAATIWPPPFSFAAVSPCFSKQAITSARSPPSTALIPVAANPASAAIALPRSRTKTMACSALITCAAAAAVISPTLWPAPTATLEKDSPGFGKRLNSETRPEATISGWAIAVSLIVSSSLLVPCSTKSMPATVPSQRIRSSKFGNSNHGVRNPGV